MNAENTLAQANLPWYEQGWPWFLILWPALAVVAGITTLVISTVTFDGTVTDDYYKEGQTIMKKIDRLELAHSLGLSAHVKVGDGIADIQLSAKQDLPSSIYLTFIHPTRAGMDQEVLLPKGVDGTYSGSFPPLRPGNWKVQIEDESRTWRMNGTVNIPTKTEINIDPSDSLSHTHAGGVSP
jgi:hypothetical protein